MSFDTIIDVLKDVCVDTAKLVPFLFLTYVAMEALEHAASGKTEELVARADKSGPAIGALLGAIPQCGFSAMAATLYAGRVITAGTLVAVILSTSDEMIPVFFAHHEEPARLLAILALKVVMGCIVGFALDAALRARRSMRAGKDDERGTREALAELVHDHESAFGIEYDSRHSHADEHDHSHESSPVAGGGHAHGHAHEAEGHGGAIHILRSAALHTLEVTVYLFVVSLAFGLLIACVGEARLGELLSVHPVRATALAALVGLIPNCAASVAISELFLAGTLPTGAMVAGLLASGGVGLLVLFRTNGLLRQNLLVAGVVYAASVLCGLAVGASGILL